MLLWTEPPAPMAVRRPGAASPLAGGTANSASTIRLAGSFFVQLAGAVSVNLPSPMAKVLPLDLSCAVAVMEQSTTRKPEKMEQRMVESQFVGGIHEQKEAKRAKGDVNELWQ